MEKIIAGNPFEADTPLNSLDDGTSTNPFEEQNKTQNGKQTPNATQEFVTLDVKQTEEKQTGKIKREPTPKQQKKKASIVSHKSFVDQAQELKQKEVEINTIINDLKSKFCEYGVDRGQIVVSTRTGSPAGEKAANWPLKNWAIVHHDIASDIPSAMQGLVSAAYRIWIFTSIGYILNCITIGYAAFHDNYYASGLEKSQALFTAVLWVAISIPFSFVLWYMNLYRMAILFSTKKWLVFNVTFACHLIFSAIILSGCPWYPCAGVFFVVSSLLNGLTVSATFGLINCIIWSIILIASFAMLNRVKQTFSENQSKKKIKKYQRRVLKLIKLGI